MTAHYYATKTQKFLIISSDMGRTGERIEVTGKHHARKIAAERGAQCWNF